MTLKNLIRETTFDMDDMFKLPQYTWAWGGEETAIRYEEKMKRVAREILEEIEKMPSIDEEESEFVLIETLLYDVYEGGWDVYQGLYSKREIINNFKIIPAFEDIYIALEECRLHPEFSGNRSFDSLTDNDVLLLLPFENAVKELPVASADLFAALSCTQIMDPQQFSPSILLKTLVEVRRGHLPENVYFKNNKDLIREFTEMEEDERITKTEILKMLRHVVFNRIEVYYELKKLYLKLKK